MTHRTIQQLFDLKGKTALVTGGSRGLGLQLAHALGEAGAKVLLSSRKASDLEEAVAAGEFRRDLYFRLKVVEILVPPLRKRPEDIETLALHFLNRLDVVTDTKPLTFRSRSRHPLPTFPFRPVTNVNPRPFTVNPDGSRLVNCDPAHEPVLGPSRIDNVIARDVLGWYLVW